MKNSRGSILRKSVKNIGHDMSHGGNTWLKVVTGLLVEKSKSGKLDCFERQALEFHNKFVSDEENGND